MAIELVVALVMIVATLGGIKVSIGNINIGNQNKNSNDT